MTNYIVNRLYIEIIQKCNAHCPFCYNDSLASEQGMMRLQTFKTLFCNGHIPHVNEIVLSGGEPTLHPELLDIVSYIRESGVESCVVITNGANMTTAMIDAFERIKGVKIQLSFYGASPEVHEGITGVNGSLRKLESIANYINESCYNVRKVLRYSVCTRNKEEVYSFYEHYHDSNQIEYGIIKYSGRGNKVFIPDNDEYGIIYRELESMKRRDSSVGIPAIPGICKFVQMEENIKVCPRITPGGDVYPCATLSTQEYCVGNINDEKLMSILYGNRMLEAVRRLKNFSMNEECKKCVFEKLCTGGCPGVAIYSGKNNDKDYLCSTRQFYLMQRLIESKGRGGSIS